MRAVVAWSLAVTLASAAEARSLSRHAATEMGGPGILRPIVAMVLPANATEHGGAATVSGVLGLCTGKAARAATSGVSMGVGCAFIALTILSKAGYVTVNYAKMERDILKLADLNKDGRLDRVDYTFASQRLVHLLSDHGLSSAAGFAAGFAAGYKQDW